MTKAFPKWNIRHTIGAGILILSITLLSNFSPFSNSEPLEEPLSSINNTTNTDFLDFTNQLFVSELSSNALSLHYTLSNPEEYGLEATPATFGSFDGDQNEYYCSIENQLALLSTFKYEELDKKNQTTYNVLLDFLTQSQQGADYYYFYEPLSPYTGLHTQLPILLAEFPLNSMANVETYLDLLESIPDYFLSLLAFEEEKYKQELFMSDSQLETVLADCQGFIDIPEHYLITTFSSRLQEVPNLSASQMQEFSVRNEYLVNTVMKNAYQSLIDGLGLFSGVSTTGGLCFYPDGRSYYSFLVRSSTGSSRSIAEISTLIKSQIQEDFDALQDAVKSTTSTENSDFFQMYNTPQSMLNYLEEEMEHAFPAKAHVSTSIKDVPSELEDYLSPAFYLIPPIDAPFENTIYINNSHMSDDLTLFTTLAHEGFPGHLYQTTYFYNTNPDPVRSILSYGGYAEGWATYTEMCSYYMTDLSDACLSQKNASIMLGLYAYTDIGIHDEGWSLADTIKFYKTYGITDTEAIQRIYDLVLATPTNYLKYYVGYLEFLALKKKCIATWGEDFTQIKFHEAVLEAGPMSFDLLEDFVLTY